MRIAIFLLSCFWFLQSTAQQKTVFVILDGIAYDVIQKLDLPNLKRIGGKKGIAPTLVGGTPGTPTESPTISAVGYNTVLTGVWAHKHNVWDNNINAPNYQYPSIFKVYKDQHPSGSIAIFSSWLDNRTKLAGEGKAETNYLRFNFHLDSLEYDTVRFPHDKAKQYMKRIDEQVVATAAQTIKTHAPDLSWVYLEFTDDVGHQHGDSEIYYDAVKNADRLMGELMDAIDYRQQQFHEEFLVIITTDHGRDAQTGKGHGGQSSREKAGWIVTNAKHLSKKFESGKAELVDIFPSIAQFMKIDLPDNVTKELEGASFIRQ